MNGQRFYCEFWIFYCSFIFAYLAEKQNYPVPTPSELCVQKTNGKTAQETSVIKSFDKSL